MSVLILVLVAQSASAQAAGEDDEARGLFLAGQAAFEGGRYEEALEHFERSYALSERPELLYNIGHTAERLREDERAIEAFEFYLEKLPETPNRATIEARLEILRAQVAEASEAEVQPTEPEPPSEPAESHPDPEPSNAPALALLVGGAALVAGGAVSLGLAASSKSAVEDAPPGTYWEDVADDAARMDRRRAIGIALLAVGAAAATVGLVLFTRSDGDRTVAVRVGPSNLAVEGSF